MNCIVRGEFTRLFATRLPLWTTIAAIICGGGLIGLVAIIGPENATPPMPGLDTPEGVTAILGLSGATLFIPAIIGTIAMTGEYQHRTISTTFLTVPVRWKVLVAKLATYAMFGLGYGAAASISAALALYGGAAAHDTVVGAPGTAVADHLVRLAVAAVAYTLLGVGIGAITRHRLVAVGTVLGYFYFLEPVLMIIPGLNTIYPYLPGGATASLTSFTYLTDSVAEQTSLTAAPALSPQLGAMTLLGYAAVAAAVAVLFPMRRDLR